MSYPIPIGAISTSFPAWLAKQSYAGYIVLCDSETNQYCRPLLEPLLAEHQLNWISIPAGEKNKNLESCQIIWDALFAAKANRNWCMLNLGGGVVGDMGGFCASTYKRGIDFVQIPTTLLSQVDASVGGKLGIDYGVIKNSIGLFRNPELVCIDPAFLNTLPPEELRSGYAEVLKHALIADAGQWAELAKHRKLAGLDWGSIIAASLQIKKDIVAADPKEKGLRKALNFGHTVGHAVEGYRLETERPLLHGEAIVVGMICEAFLSQAKAGLSKEEVDEISQCLLELYGHEPIPEEQFSYLIDIMRQDKKNEDSRINFSALSKIGSVVVNQIASEEEIVESILFYNKLV